MSDLRVLAYTNTEPFVIKDCKPKVAKCTGRKCQICGVRQAIDTCQKTNIIMARFPSEKGLCQKWVQITGRKILTMLPLSKLRTKYICLKHFDTKDFNKSGKLYSDAVPSLWLSRSPLKDDELEFPVEEPMMTRRHALKETIGGPVPFTVPGEPEVPLCVICLRTDRSLKAMEASLTRFYKDLVTYNVPKNLMIRYCSICETTLRKCYNFKRKCIEASRVLVVWQHCSVEERPPKTLLHEQLRHPKLDIWSKNNMTMFYHNNDPEKTMTGKFEINVKKSESDEVLSMVMVNNIDRYENVKNVGTMTMHDKKLNVPLKDTNDSSVKIVAKKPKLPAVTKYPIKMIMNGKQMNVALAPYSKRLLSKKLSTMGTYAVKKSFVRHPDNFAGAKSPLKLRAITDLMNKRSNEVSDTKKSKDSTITYDRKSNERGNISKNNAVVQLNSLVRITIVESDTTDLSKTNKVHSNANGKENEFVNVNVVKVTRGSTDIHDPLEIKQPIQLNQESLEGKRKDVITLDDLVKLTSVENYNACQRISKDRVERKSFGNKTSLQHMETCSSNTVCDPLEIPIGIKDDTLVGKQNDDVTLGDIVKHFAVADNHVSSNLVSQNQKLNKGTLKKAIPYIHNGSPQTKPDTKNKLPIPKTVLDYIYKVAGQIKGENVNLVLNRKADNELKSYHITVDNGIVKVKLNEQTNKQAAKVIYAAQNIPNAKKIVRYEVLKENRVILKEVVNIKPDGNKTSKATYDSFRKKALAEIAELDTDEEDVDNVCGEIALDDTMRSDSPEEFDTNGTQHINDNNSQKDVDTGDNEVKNEKMENNEVKNYKMENDEVKNDVMENVEVKNDAENDYDDSDESEWGEEADITDRERKYKIRYKLDKTFLRCKVPPVTSDGYKVNKNLILWLFKKNMSIEDILYLNKHLVSVYEEELAPDLVNVLAELQRKYESQYARIFDIVELETEEEILREFERKKLSAAYIHSKFRCDMCHNAYRLARELRNHLTVHTAAFGEFECDICHIRRKTKHKLEIHRALHEVVFKCKLCPLVTFRKKIILEHTRRHQGYTYICEMCGCNKDTLNAYRKHISAHHFNYFCVFCAQKFRTQLRLDEHIIAKHEGMDIAQSAGCTLCEQCNIMFATRAVYKKHVKNSHTRETQWSRFRFDQPEDNVRKVPKRPYKKKKKLALDQPDNSEDQPENSEGQPYNSEDQPYNSEDQPENSEGQPYNSEDQPYNSEDQTYNASYKTSEDKHQLASPVQTRETLTQLDEIVESADQIDYTMDQTEDIVYHTDDMVYETVDIVDQSDDTMYQRDDIVHQADDILYQTIGGVDQSSNVDQTPGDSLQSRIDVISKRLKKTRRSRDVRDYAGHRSVKRRIKQDGSRKRIKNVKMRAGSFRSEFTSYLEKALDQYSTN